MRLNGQEIRTAQLQAMIESQTAVNTLYNAIKGIRYSEFKHHELVASDEINEYIQDFMTAMDDDFNTAKAISVLFDIAKKVRRVEIKLESRQQFALLLVKLGQVLGFFHNIDEKLKNNINLFSEDLIKLFISYRNDFKKNKNYQMADKIRDDLKEIGIQLKDGKDGTEWEMI
jgi:cysteinyl-tRNA synthetase